MNDDQRLLASAALDGAVTTEERARAEADPEVRAEIERLRAVRDQLRADVAPDPAAAGGVDRRRPRGVRRAAATVSPLPRRRRSTARRRARWLAPLAAAAAVVVIVVGAVVAGGGDDGSDDAAAPAATELAPAAAADRDATAGGRARQPPRRPPARRAPAPPPPRPRGRRPDGVGRSSRPRRRPPPRCCARPTSSPPSPQRRIALECRRAPARRRCAARDAARLGVLRGRRRRGPRRGVRGRRPRGDRRRRRRLQRRRPRPAALTPLAAPDAHRRRDFPVRGGSTSRVRGHARQPVDRSELGRRTWPTRSSGSSARSARRRRRRSSTSPAASSTGCSPRSSALTAVVLLVIALTRALQALLDLGRDAGAGGLPELPHPRGNPQPRRVVAPAEASTPRRLIAEGSSPMTNRPQRHHRRLRPRRPDGRDLRRPGQPRAARHRGRAVEHQRPARWPADADHRRRELPRLPRRDHGSRADGPVPRAGRALRRRVHHREGDEGRPRRRARSGSGCATPCTRPTP